MRATCVAAIALCLLGTAGDARAEFDWPLMSALPDHNIALGISGGLAFSEDHGRGSMGLALGLDLSYLHGPLGVHLSLNTFRERTGWRVQPMGEVSIWYVALFGVGVSVAPMVGELPSDAPAAPVALHALLGFPIPILSLGEADDAGGALVLVPFARPGLRLGERGAVTGHHTVGVMLKWTSFSF